MIIFKLLQILVYIVTKYGTKSTNIRKFLNQLQVLDFYLNN